MEGKIITFYSYKGGVGRSMALANIAILMKRWGYKVLMLDWDLEARGIENFFKDYISVTEFQKKEGIVDILLSHTEGENLDWRDAVQTISIEANNTGRLELITSGIRDDNYFKNVRKFDFDDFYINHDGGEFIENLRNQWKNEYDFVLVDSRTGVTDIGGVCTVQLPDIVVLLFTATEQSLQGIIKVGKKINESLANLPVERYNIPILPIPSRFDNVTEFKIGQEWLERFSKELLPLVESWLPEEYQSPLKYKTILEQLKVPYIPYFSFGEKLPVIEQGTSDSTGLGYAYENIFLVLATKLHEIDLLVTNRELLITQLSKSTDIFYDVFISRATNDAHIAKDLYNYLAGLGLKVFDSYYSLPVHTNIDYVKTIDIALLNTRHLIVIGTSLENITSSWVEAEWRFYISQKRTGKVNGRLITMITNNIELEELPPSLQNNDVIVVNSEYYEKTFEEILPIINDNPKNLDFGVINTNKNEIITNFLKKSNKKIYIFIFTFSLLMFFILYRYNMSINTFDKTDDTRLDESKLRNLEREKLLENNILESEIQLYDAKKYIAIKEYSLALKKLEKTKQQLQLDTLDNSPNKFYEGYDEDIENAYTLEQNRTDLLIEVESNILFCKKRIALKKGTN